MATVALRGGLALVLSACLIPSSYAQSVVANGHPAKAHKPVQAGGPLPDRPGPARGGFVWTRFTGQYDLSECWHNPGPIWDDSPQAGNFVLIEDHEDFGRIPGAHSLNVIRGNPSRILALGWTIENIGEKPELLVDSETGKLDRTWESYATVDGIYGARAWDHPYNTGWSTFQIRMDAREKITYEMRQKTDSDPVTREEICTLTPRAAPGRLQAGPEKDRRPPVPTIY